MKLAVNTLLLSVAALLVLGMVMLYSASMTQSGAKLLKAQLVWCVLGFASAAVAATMDYRLLKKFVWPVFSGALVLLVLVFICGHGSHGARRWLVFHGFSFQPSELAKLALIIFLACYVEQYQRQMHTWEKGIIIPGAFIVLMLAPIFREPDRGTTILLACVGGAMLVLAGVRWKYILPPACAAAAALAWSLWHDPMRRARILAFLHPEESKDGVGYQVWQGILALGSGGWFGNGLGNSRQKLGFIPEHQTDFILPIIGEELGLIATLAVVVVFALLFASGIVISLRARDTFGQSLAAGISFLIALQAAINIGVITASLPNKGIALPFISYGGSNLMMMMTCVGILLSIARHGRADEPVTGESPSLQPAR